MEAPRQRSSDIPLRICHVLEASGGGSGQVVLDLVRYGRRQGDDITVIYSTLRAEASFVAALQAIPGVKLLTLPMERKVGAHDVKHLWKLWKVLHDTGPFDIVHGHSSKAGALTRLAGLFLHGHVVYTPHGFYTMGQNVSPIFGLIERFLSLLSACVVCVSTKELRHGERLGISGSKLCLIPNGANPVFSVPREKIRNSLRVNDDTVVFGFVGRFVPPKNPMRTVAAFAKASRQFPDARLAVIGDGTFRPDVEAEIRRYGIRDSVMLLGAQPALDFLPGFDCLVGSSDYEAMPICFLESLNAGMPIVTTPVGGTEETVVEGRTGFTAREFTAEALSEAMTLYLSKSPEERRDMAALAKEHAKNFSRENMGERYRDLYRRVCRKGFKTLAPASEASVPS